eukprot:190652-Chlamydomonas_euryale.AAC.1
MSIDTFLNHVNRHLPKPCQSTPSACRSTPGNGCAGPRPGGRRAGGGRRHGEAVSPTPRLHTCRRVRPHAAQVELQQRRPRVARPPQGTAQNAKHARGAGDIATAASAAAAAARAAAAACSGGSRGASCDCCRRGRGLSIAGAPARRRCRGGPCHVTCTPCRLLLLPLHGRRSRRRGRRRGGCRRRRSAVPHLEAVHLHARA